MCQSVSYIGKQNRLLELTEMKIVWIHVYERHAVIIFTIGNTKIFQPKENKDQNILLLQNLIVRYIESK